MDVLIIGSGFAGSVIARKLLDKRNDLKIRIIDKRNHIAGNMYDEFNEDGILIQKYGPHIFHTNSKEVFDFIGRFTEYRFYQHKVVGAIDGEIVPIPFNFAGIDTYFPFEDAQEIKKELLSSYKKNERVPIGELLKSDNTLIKMLGKFIYEKVFVYYTAKQWGLPIEQIDSSVFNRIPVLMGYEENHFISQYQYMPKNGFTPIFKEMLESPNIEVMLNVNAKNLLRFDKQNGKIFIENEEFTGPIIMTGALDELLDYKFGVLPYRSLDLQYETYDMNYYQENSVVNYPNSELFTRITEFKYLTGQKKDGKTTILKEYPCEYEPTINVPFYPIVNEESYVKYEKYKEYLSSFSKLYLCGRLAEYKYYDMNSVIQKAFAVAKKILEENFK